MVTTGDKPSKIMVHSVQLIQVLTHKETITVKHALSSAVINIEFTL